MKTVLIDFDGVLHSYVSGWKGKAEIADDPNPGAIEWLKGLIADDQMEPVIWTSRVHWANDSEVIDAENAMSAIRTWLYVNGMSREEVEILEITGSKKPAVLLIDDRAFKFEGNFPSIDYIENFRPWKPGEEE